MIPKDVEKDAEDVAQWEAEMEKRKQADGESITAEPEETSGTTEQSQPSEPTEPKEPAEKVSEPPKETQPEKAPTENAPAHDEKSIDYYRQRAETVIGLNKQQASELKVLKDENRTLSGKVEEFEERLKSLEKPDTGKDVSGTQDGEDDNVSEIYSPEFVTEYGEDLLKGVAKGSRKIIGKVIKSFEDKIKNLESKVSNTESATAEQMFWGNVERKCPTATELNNNPTPEYMEWLDQKPQGVPYTRRQMGEDAMRKGDFKYVGELVNSFLGNRKMAAPPVQQERKPSDIIPNLSGSSASESAGKGKKPIYTQKQIDQFYRDAERGVYDSRQAERDKIEKQIESAYAEGRIQG